MLGFLIGILTGGLFGMLDGLLIGLITARWFYMRPMGTLYHRVIRRSITLINGITAILITPLIPHQDALSVIFVIGLPLLIIVVSTWKTGLMMTERYEQIAQSNALSLS